MIETAQVLFMSDPPVGGYLTLKPGLGGLPAAPATGRRLAHSQPGTPTIFTAFSFMG
jgi:hypothetical protein